MKTVLLLPLLFFLFSCTQPADTKKQKPYAISVDTETLGMGNELSRITFQRLSTVLKSRMQTGGVHEAITYCNKNAYPLTDSISAANGVIIRRTSLKFRNPANQPDTLERLVINQFQELLNQGKEISPLVYSDGISKRYFSPIRTKELCLKCHGIIGGDIASEDDRFIKEKYPNDLATGYKKGDLRGIWSITFNP